MKTKLIATSHHRNGICGDPFNVHLFKDEDGIKVAVDFGEMRFAVLQVDKLAKNDIAFGSNSFRGDHFADEIRELACKAKPDVAKGAFFVNYGVPA